MVMSGMDMEMFVTASSSCPWVTSHVAIISTGMDGSKSRKRDINVALTVSLTTSHHCPMWGM